MWILLALIAALLNVAENMLRRLRKGYADPLQFAWLIYSFGAPISVVPFLLSGSSGHVQHLDMPYFIAIVTICAVTAVMLARAFQISEVSLLVPILTFLPVFRLATSYLMLGEIPSVVGIVGVIVIVAGAYYIHAVGRQKSVWMPLVNIYKDMGSMLVLGCVFLWSISTNIEKKMYVQGYSAELIAMIMYVGVWVILSVVILIKKQIGLKEVIKKYWGVAAFIALISVAIFIIQTVAIGTAPSVSYAIAIKRLDVPLSVLAGWVFYREMYVKRRLVGAIAMCAGAVLIYLWG